MPKKATQRSATRKGARSGQRRNGVERDALALLSDEIRAWMAKKNWTLTDIQQKAIPTVHEIVSTGQARDCIISASTATGKTEAVFLPLATILGEVSDSQSIGAAVLYVCPLTALIDQQAKRLRVFFDEQRCPVVPWHASSGRPAKKDFEAAPRGIVVITPESLEAQFIKNGADGMLTLYGNLRCVVIDELHAFIGSPRGYQLLSQLNRLESIAGDRWIPRIGLSATFAQDHLPSIREQLRPSVPENVEVVESSGDANEIEFFTHSFLTPGMRSAVDAERDGALVDQIFEDFAELGTVETDGQRPGELKKGLIFVNSRQQAEHFSKELTAVAKKRDDNCRFYPHHGSLDSTVRRKAEAKIRSKRDQAVVVATSTLELGIDIGAIAQVGQIDPGSSVASLRQRLGRSGRKHNELSKLIVYVRESSSKAGNDTLNQLRLSTVQALAQVSLVKDRAYESPDIRPAHLSTLLQQVLSMAKCHGVVSRDMLQEILIDKGPFRALGSEQDPDYHFALFLARLVYAGLLEQRDADRYTIGDRGLRMMVHYSFYAAFTTATEYTVQGPQGALGRIPVGSAFTIGDRIIFAGDVWRITAINPYEKTIHVTSAEAGDAPIFRGDPIPPSEMVVTRMRDIYSGAATSPDDEMSESCRDRLREGRQAFRALGLSARCVVPTKAGVLVFPWCGERGQMSLLYAMRFWGLNAIPASIAIYVQAPANDDSVRTVLSKLADGDLPSNTEAVRNAPSLLVDKHDRHLSPYLQRWNLASFRVDMKSVPAQAKALLGTST